MSSRAVILGILGAAVIAAVGYFNDLVMRQTFLFGSYLPIFVFGLLIIFVVLVNPLAYRIWSRLALTGRELAVIVALSLPGAYVSGRSLMHHFTNVMMMPHHYNITVPGWQEHEVIRATPPTMLAGIAPHYVDGDILKARAMCEHLLGGVAPGGPAARAKTRDALDPGARAQLRAALGESQGRTDGGESICRRHVRRALNGLLEAPRLVSRADFAGTVLPRRVEHLLVSGPRNDGEVRKLNRYLIDAAFPEELRSLLAREDHAIGAFQQGLGVGREHISFWDIPWYAWWRTLLFFWVPLVLVVSCAMIGLAGIVHRQWSEHEHLPYPVVSFARSILPEEGSVAASIFRNRLFWIAAGVVTLIHLNNYAYQWWSTSMVEIPTRFDFRSLSPLIPALRRGGDWGIMNPRIYFTVVGFAYFVATDVSLSIGVAPFAFAIIAGVLANYGVSLSAGSYNSLRIDNFINAGAYLGMFFIVLYTGRHYFASVFRRGLFLKATDDVRPHEIWGARLFLLCAILFVLQLKLVGAGLGWAIFYVVVTAASFVALSRVVAETGMFLIHPHVFPCVMLWGFVGAKVIGPEALLVMLLVSSVIHIGAHVAVMPVMVHGLKLADERPGRIMAFGAVALLAALAVAIPLVLYIQHDLGARATSDGWTRWIPRYAFDATVTIQNRLKAQGVLEQAGNLSGLDWIKGWTPHGGAVLAFVIALGLVLLFEVARLRLPRWPLHPVIVIASGSWQARQIAVSFLIGWFVKVMVNKYGGAASYRRLKPFMIGLIAGDMLGGVFPLVTGAIYYFVTGTPPKSFAVLPG